MGRGRGGGREGWEGEGEGRVGAGERWGQEGWGLGGRGRLGIRLQPGWCGGVRVGGGGVPACMLW